MRCARCGAWCVVFWAVQLTPFSYLPLVLFLSTPPALYPPPPFGPVCRGCGIGRQARLRWLSRWWTIATGASTPPQCEKQQSTIRGTNLFHASARRARGRGCAHCLQCVTIRLLVVSCHCSIRQKVFPIFSSNVSLTPCKSEGTTRLPSEIALDGACRGAHRAISECPQRLLQTIWSVRPLSRGHFQAAKATRWRTGSD